MLRETSNNRSCQIVSVTDGVVTYLVRRSVTARQILTTIILVRFRNKLLYSTWGLQNFNRIEINPLKQIRCKMSTIEICLSLGQVFRERLSSSQSIRNALTPNHSFGILCCHNFFFFFFQNCYWIIWGKKVIWLSSSIVRSSFLLVG